MGVGTQEPWPARRTGVCAFSLAQQGPPYTSIIKQSTRVGQGYQLTSLSPHQAWVLRHSCDPGQPRGWYCSPAAIPEPGTPGRRPLPRLQQASCTSQHPLGWEGGHHAVGELVEQQFVEDHKVVVASVHGRLEALRRKRGKRSALGCDTTARHTSPSPHLLSLPLTRTHGNSTAKARTSLTRP